MNKRPTILHIGLATPLRKIFDYLLPDHIEPESVQPGMRVRISFGSRETIGIVVKISSTSELPIDQLKTISAIIDTESVIPNVIFSLCQWASDYYQHSFGDVLFNALPTLLRQERKSGKSFDLWCPRSTDNNDNIFASHSIILNVAQQQAVEKITQHLDHYHTFLLYGITGSGKTEVYFQVIEKVLKNKKQALVLIPEISLTPQTLQRFKDRFNVTIISCHSKMTPRERFDAWVTARSGNAHIIIGTRSAIFIPAQSLGIIIVDEEHDPSFKQQEGFRYSARDLAVVRSHLENIPIVLGSATPSLESLCNAKLKRYSLLSLPERAGSAIHPNYHLLDMRNQTLNHGLSKSLLEVIKKHLEANNQVLIFLNRRGYAPTLLCHHCGWIATCQHCDAHLTLHKNPPHLHCHHCDHKQPIFSACPQCQHKRLQNLGIGTERLEKALSKHFPDVSIIRIDRDTTKKKNALENLLQEMHQNKSKILIGTQMIAKGHHFPNVTLVCIINADYGFFSSDFRATERTGQLLIQVAGRAGRAEKPGEVFIQTYNPNHPLLKHLTEQGYESFANSLLSERRESQLPPYSSFALIRAEALKKELPEQFLMQIKSLCESAAHQYKVNVLGPIPSPMQKRKRHFRAQLLFQSKQRSQLQKFLKIFIPMIDDLKRVNHTRWSLDVDPIELF